MTRLLIRFVCVLAMLMGGAVVGFASDCVSDPNQCTPKVLCEIATEISDGKKRWSTSTRSTKHVAFAQQLGMTCEVIDPCANDPSQCSVKALCQKATEKKKGEIDWNINAQAHVALAKEYGISCGVLTSTAKGDLREYTFTKNDFMKLSKKERKQLQFGLKSLGLYTSAIDGLWGSATSKAIRSFNKKYNIKTNYPISVHKKIMSLVDVPNSFNAKEQKNNSTSIITSSSNTFKGRNIVYDCKRKYFFDFGFISKQAAESWYPNEIYVAFEAENKWMASSYGVDRSRSKNEKKFNMGTFKVGLHFVKIRAEKLSRTSGGEIYVDLQTQGYKDTQPATYSCKKGVVTDWEPSD